MRKIQLDGGKIKQLRDERDHGSTQKEFAHEVRISERALRAIENAHAPVPLDTANRIAGALKKSLQSILSAPSAPPASAVAVSATMAKLPRREILPRFDEYPANVISDEALMFDVAKGNRVLISHVLTALNPETSAERRSAAATRDVKALARPLSSPTPRLEATRISGPLLHSVVWF